MVSRILVATDGSDAAWKAVEFAVDLAKQTAAPLTLLYVGDPSGYVSRSVPDPADPGHLQEPLEDYLKQEGDAILSDAEDLCGEKGVSATKAIRMGDPREEIIREAEASHADLIVVGSHGKSSLQATLVGSVTYGLIHHESKIPVLVVRR